MARLPPDSVTQAPLLLSQAVSTMRSGRGCWRGPLLTAFSPGELAPGVIGWLARLPPDSVTQVPAWVSFVLCGLVRDGELAPAPDLTFRRVAPYYHGC